MASQSSPSEAEYDDDEEAVGYVDKEGEWRDRKINLFSVVRSFVSQLKPGQDLTRVSLPAEVCYPFGMLELVASRQLKTLYLLFDMNKESSNPLERFLCVLRFFLGTIRSETFNKKPWNAVLGESHVAWTVHPLEPDRFESNSIFVGEQVSHHPPVTAFIVQNCRENVVVSSNVWFGVRFGGNYASVTTGGGFCVENTRLKESYQFTKFLPDIMVRNVVWGQKYIVWDGEIKVECPNTSLSARIKFKEDANGKSALKGHIIDKNNVVKVELEGLCGKKIYIKPYSESNELNIKGRTLLIDFEDQPYPQLRYFTYGELDPLSTVKVWKQVNDAVVNGNISLADKKKKQVEISQRERTRALEESGTQYVGKYFKYDEESESWVYNHSLKLEKLSAEHALRQKKSVSKSSDYRVEKRGDQSERGRGGPMAGLPQDKGRAKKAAMTSSEDLPGMSKFGSGGSALASEMSEDTLAPIRLSDRQTRRGCKEMKSGDSMKPGEEENLSSASQDSSLLKKSLKEKKKQVREEVKMVYNKMKEIGKKSRQDSDGEEVIHSGWVKIRNSFKKWRDRWAVLEPGRLIYYRSQSDVPRRNCLGILMLSGCDVRPRPSKMNDFCFKVYNVNHYPIYSKNGLKGETISRALLPVGGDYAIIRVKEEADKWLECIRQAIPDWEKNKPYFSSAVSDTANSATEEESECSGEMELNASKIERVHSLSNTTDEQENQPDISHKIRKLQLAQEACIELIDERFKDVDTSLRDLISKPPHQVVPRVQDSGVTPKASAGRASAFSMERLVLICVVLVVFCQIYLIRRDLSKMAKAMEFVHLASENP